MIKVENIEVFNFEGALRGMRNPMNSWEKGDSFICESCNTNLDNDRCFSYMNCPYYNSSGINNYIIGPNDLTLAQKLIKAGPEHAKFMRQIFVSMDITAPIYFAKEFDTYKVSTVRNSCSTMHKIHSKEFTLDDFSCEHLISEEVKEVKEVKEENNNDHYYYLYDWKESLLNTIKNLNFARKLYSITKDKKYWWQMIQLLPSSYNQKFTWTANYAILRNIYFQRKNHRLDEWIHFTEVISSLPYAKELICYKLEDN